MTTATLTIPAAHVPAIADSLLVLYGTKAESAHRTVAQHEDLPSALVDVRGQHSTLEAIGHLLDQLGWDATPREDDQLVTGERNLLAEALHSALCDATEALDHACQDFLNGGTADRLREHHERAGGVLVMLATIGPTTTQLPLPDDLAERVHAYALRSGQTPSESVNAALEKYLQQRERGGMSKALEAELIAKRAEPAFRAHIDHILAEEAEVIDGLGGD